MEIKACSVCWGSGFDLSGKPCPCDCVHRPLRPAPEQDIVIYSGIAKNYEQSDLEAIKRDAERYRLLRRGQHWSVIDGIGDTLRAETLAAAIDTAMAQIHNAGN